MQRESAVIETGRDSQNTYRIFMIKVAKQLHEVVVDLLLLRRESIESEGEQICTRRVVFRRDSTQRTRRQQSTVSVAVTVIPVVMRVSRMLRMVVLRMVSAAGGGVRTTVRVMQGLNQLCIRLQSTHMGLMVW